MTDRSSEPTTSVTSSMPDDGRPPEQEAREQPEQEQQDRRDQPEQAPRPERPEPPEQHEPPEPPEQHEPSEQPEQPRTETAEDAPSRPAEGTETSDPAASASTSRPAPRIRRSHATPQLPPEARETDESALSEFFDTLDARFDRATTRLAESLYEIIDGDRQVAEHDEDAEPDVPAVGSAAPRPPEEQDDEPDPASSLPAPPRPAAQEELAEHTPPAGPAAELSATESAQHLPPVEHPGRLSLPRPPSATDDRPLPWDQATGSRNASAERRRAVILEKASAIEAATSQEDEPLTEDRRADDEEDLYTYIPPYNLPSRDPDPAPRPLDLARRAFVTLGAGAAVVSALWMLGWQADTRILAVGGLDDLVDGWYSGRRSLLTPQAVYYWLWPLVAVGLVLHALHQWAPSQRSTPRQRRSGWLVGLASWLMLGWTGAVHADLLWLAVLASLAAALALLDAVRQFTFQTARSISERRLTDAPVGLFTGWALVGAMSSASIALTAVGVHIPGLPGDLWGMVGLMATVWTGAYYAMTERGRMSVALGMGFGLLCLVFPRLISEVTSAWVAVGAAFGAFIVVLATESRRHRINHAERRAAMGRPVDDII